MIERENFIDAVVGPQSYHKINKIIENIDIRNKLNYTDFETIEKFDVLKTVERINNNKVTAYLTIQEGCDKFCKFCVVPYTRGAEYSRSINEILNEANQLVDNGSQEITLLGQNVNAYNYNNKKLSDLIMEIDKIKDLKRIRYTTSHPKDMTEDLLEVYKTSKKLMPLVHLPVQSGSNKILKSMNRKHTIEEYLTTFDKLKEINSKIEFSSDFIIGYPGEEDQDFKDTFNLIERVKFINSYSFIFSPRPGTPASDMKIIDEKLAKKRLMTFQNIAENIKINYKKQLLNQIVKVLFENKMEKVNDKYFGRDEYQNPVIVVSKKNIIGQEKKVLIKKFSQHTIYGELIDTDNFLAA